MHTFSSTTIWKAKIFITMALRCLLTVLCGSYQLSVARKDPHVVHQRSTLSLRCFFVSLTLHSCQHVLAELQVRTGRLWVQGHVGCQRGQESGRLRSADKQAECLGRSRRVWRQENGKTPWSLEVGGSPSKCFEIAKVVRQLLVGQIT